MAVIFKAVVVTGILLILLTAMGLWYMNRAATRREKRQQRKDEMEHEERMELFNDEEL